MISVSLRDFAATGEFGPIRLGTTRDEIRRQFGTPELWGSEERMEAARIWRYSEIEFYFADHILYMIFTDHDALTNGGDKCRIDPWIIRRGLPRDRLEAALNADDVPFVVSQPAYDTRQRLVRTAAKVEFGFLEEQDHELGDEQLGLFSWNQRTES